MIHDGGDDVSAIVAEIGSSFSRVGFAGDDYPKARFPSVSFIFASCRTLFFVKFMKKKQNLLNNDSSYYYFC